MTTAVALITVAAILIVIGLMGILYFVFDISSTLTKIYYDGFFDNHLNTIDTMAPINPPPSTEANIE